MRLKFSLLPALFLVIGVAGCGTLAQSHVSIHQSTNEPQSKTSQRPDASNMGSKPSIVQLSIYATIQQIHVGTNNTIVTVEVDSVKKVYGKVGHVPIRKGSVISISYQGTPKDYFVGDRSPTKYLPVWSGLDVATVITSDDNGVTWNSLFDSYEYQKYGAYWNWKGQNFGMNVFK